MRVCLLTEHCLKLVLRKLPARLRLIAMALKGMKVMKAIREIRMRILKTPISCVCPGCTKPFQHKQHFLNHLGKRLGKLYREENLTAADCAKNPKCIKNNAVKARARVRPSEYKTRRVIAWRPYRKARGRFPSGPSASISQIPRYTCEYRRRKRYGDVWPRS